MTKPDLVFEASWEVCNKVGGIYTVLISKAALMAKNYNEGYFLVGPYFENQAKFEFEEKNPDKIMSEVFNDLKNEGIKCYYGKWKKAAGKPNTILIDFKDFVSQKDKIKTDLWDNFKVDSIFSKWDFDEPIIWSTAVGKFVESYYNKKNSKIVLHCHEWLSGAGLLYIKQNKIKVATVFTTHATILGRTLSSTGFDLYNNLDKINGYEEAKKYNIIDKYSIEAACALNSDVFTTVSEITSLESEKLLGKKPEILVLNGLDIDKFPSFEETSILHQKNREIIREFVAYYFFPYDNFDLEQTLIFFIVGRYEFKNKGIDILIKSLAELNKKLQDENSKKTVIVFFWIPTQVDAAKQELAKNKLNYHQLNHFVDANSKMFQTRLIENILKIDSSKGFEKEEFHLHNILGDEFIEEIKTLKINFKKEGQPPVSTHNIHDEKNDPILRSFYEHGLNNSPQNKVKVVFYPIYLNGIDGLLDLPYYDTISGCHLGLFPSYYEPWGYTPLESAAWGVPSLTTDLGGFGRFLLNKDKGDSGVFVLKRFKINEEEVINNFSNIMYNFTKLHRKGRVDEKLVAKKISNLADWKIFIKNYINSHELAVDRVY